METEENKKNICEENESKDKQNTDDNNTSQKFDEQSKKTFWRKITGWKKWTLLAGTGLVILAAIIGILFATHVLCIHKWSEATCTEPQICSICEREQGKPLGHDWNEATCTEPEICKVCGEEQGKALGHKWIDATCLEPETCSVCGETKGKALGHSWTAATCLKPKTCSICGETEGSTLSHSWKAATCTKPKTCTKCGTTSGKAKGHNWSNATCTEPKICKVCNKKSGKAKGHTWVAATIEKPKTCSVCGITEGSKLNYSYIGSGVVDVNSDSTLLLRESMSDSAKNLASIPDGVKIDIWDTGKKGWYYSKYEGKYGYVKSEYVDLSECGIFRSAEDVTAYYNREVKEIMDRNNSNDDILKVYKYGMNVDTYDISFVCYDIRLLYEDNYSTYLDIVKELKEMSSTVKRAYNSVGRSDIHSWVYILIPERDVPGGSGSDLVGYLAIRDGEVKSEMTNIFR
ncbi:MAG: SH3 domain-containing protein [Oscillospiraceae bacterium]|nr:SH3 domain-containing protein [Oscillospiraceae bacterium]